MLIVEWVEASSCRVDVTLVGDLTSVQQFCCFERSDVRTASSVAPLIKTFIFVIVQCYRRKYQIIDILELTLGHCRKANSFTSPVTSMAWARATSLNLRSLYGTSLCYESTYSFYLYIEVKFSNRFYYCAEKKMHECMSWLQIHIKVSCLLNLQPLSAASHVCGTGKLALPGPTSLHTLILVCLKNKPLNTIISNATKHDNIFWKQSCICNISQQSSQLFRAYVFTLLRVIMS